MSMTQEEIEALMNGIDAADETPPAEEEEVSTETMSEDDIESLIAQTQSTEETDQQDPAAEEESVDDILASFENEESAASVEAEEENIDDILAGIEGVVDDTPSEQPQSEENIDDILAGIEGVVDNTSSEEAEKTKEDIDHEAIGRDWTDKQIEEGVFPLPVEKNTKVVGQLSEVASDSEEKATKIFDVLSYILDENNEVQKNAKALDDFVQKQTVLLDSLSKKFPNIEVFKANLELAQSLGDSAKSISSRVDAENVQLFEAMELMQFHDINRQKIERVMSVIRKLSDYLNGLFEDDGSHANISVAKHIHGDESMELVGNEDLDALIAEFGN